MILARLAVDSLWSSGEAKGMEAMIARSASDHIDEPGLEDGVSFLIGEIVIDFLVAAHALLGDMFLMWFFIEGLFPLNLINIDDAVPANPYSFWN